MRIITSIYVNVKSCLMMHTRDTSDQPFISISEFFPCQNGLREGENLSPILFSLFVNDLKNYFHENNAGGLPISTFTNTILEENVLFFTKLFLIMYADDTVLFSNTRKGLQNRLIYIRIFE